ncbi:MAG TPA: hypothetical protein VNT55_06915 [Baekduia sp.]|nr:hypothetical protein [Baekduia sp.]
MTRAVAVAVAVGAVLLAAPVGAPAKGRVTATITAPARCDAAPGTKVTIAFALKTAATADEPSRPFGASGIFVVLRRTGGRPGLKRAATSAGAGMGEYRARVTVPRGGIRRIDVGLEGVRTAPGGRTQDADVLFRVVGDPCRLAGVTRSSSFLYGRRDLVVARWMRYHSGQQHR